MAMSAEDRIEALESVLVELARALIEKTPSLAVGLRTQIFHAEEAEKDLECLGAAEAIAVLKREIFDA